MASDGGKEEAVSKPNTSSSQANPSSAPKRLDVGVRKICQMEAELEALKLEHCLRQQVGDMNNQDHQKDDAPEIENEEDEDGKESDEYYSSLEELDFNDEDTDVDRDEEEDGDEYEDEDDYNRGSHRSPRSHSLSPEPLGNIITLQGGTADIELSIISADLRHDHYGVYDYQTYDNDDNIEDNKDDDDLFYLACKRERGEDMMRILHADPIRILAKNSDGNTALHKAARFGELENVKLLVRFILTHRDENQRRLTSVTERNTERDTPLHVAAQASKGLVASYLIKKKPMSAYYLNNKGISPLHIAVERGLNDTVEEMFRELPGNKLSKATMEKLVGSQNAFPAHSAIEQQNLPMLRVLLENLPSLVESQNREGWKPLSYAAYNGYVDEASFLLQNFPGCARKHDEDGSFPIHRAVSQGHINVIAKLLSRCSETMFQKDKKQRTILHVAVRYKKPQVLMYLNQEHGDKLKNMLNSRDDDGNTFKDLARMV